ncbi:MAG: Asp-tRNA(Asn)/Glu-tRNA(Gln) amidotransferase subunit GatC [Trueperaceae bacterium]|nr:MAG: Asp-tRNA(Asn)/Glu-tRNA(Gln) amidotransferase subunit GatC [Trueperaceae bacterium]
MELSDLEMAHLKRLARLELSREETAALQKDLSDILGYFDQLRGLDTGGVEELVRPITTVDVFREDVIRLSLPHEKAMSLAVEAQEGFFRVPRTVEEA